MTKGSDRDGQRALKVGRTTSWDTRRQGYTGLDAPDDATLLLRVEKALRRMLREMVHAHSGYERSVIPARQLDLIMPCLALTIDLHPLHARVKGCIQLGQATMERRQTIAEGRRRRLVQEEHCSNLRIAAEGFLLQNIVSAVSRLLLEVETKKAQSTKKLRPLALTRGEDSPTESGGKACARSLMRCA